MTTQIYNFDVFRGFLAHFLLEEFVSDEISANFHSGDEFGLVENSCPEFFLKIFTLYKLEPKEVAEDALIDQIINDLSFGKKSEFCCKNIKMFLFARSHCLKKTLGPWKTRLSTKPSAKIGF